MIIFTILPNKYKLKKQKHKKIIPVTNPNTRQSVEFITGKPEKLAFEN